MSDVTLKLDWCSHEAAKYAVEKWHYSHTMPAGKIVKIGAWENNVFIGAVLFSRGANNNIGSPYKLGQIEVCELTRIALHKHASPVSRIVSIAIKMLKKQSPELRLIVSYADPAQDHHGGIYQAMNWLYKGPSESRKGAHFIINGKYMHGRTMRSKYGHESKIPFQWEYATAHKHTYLYPLDDAMRAQIVPLAKPYPKRSDPLRLSSNSKMPVDQTGDNGATPIQTLSTSADTHEISF